MSATLACGTRLAWVGLEVSKFGPRVPLPGSPSWSLTPKAWGQPTPRTSGCCRPRKEGGEGDRTQASPCGPPQLRPQSCEKLPFHALALGRSPSPLSPPCRDLALPLLSLLPLTDDSATEPARPRSALQFLLSSLCDLNCRLFFFFSFLASLPSCKVPGPRLSPPRSSDTTRSLIHGAPWELPLLCDLEPVAALL